MGNTIQHYSFNDMSSYWKSIKLNTTIEELNSRQSEERRRSSVTIVDKNDAATIEISELAKAMYGASVNASVGQKDVDTAYRGEKEAAETGKEANDPNRYAGLSGVERDLKELEDYIASHPVDKSLDLLRRGSLVQQNSRAAVSQVDEALIAAEKEYTDAFANAAEDFADFSMKITYGAYSSNDVSVEDLNFEAIDKMEETYQSYKNQIQSDYEGDEREKYLNKLDEVYQAVFAEKILDPMKSAFDDKLFFFKPDSEETMKSIRAASTSKETLNEMVSGYLANQMVNKKQYATLADGTKNFYDLADNSSLWHDTAMIRSILTESMNAYSSVKEVNAGGSMYLSEKAAANEISKKISDKYAESLAYKEEMLGFRKDGKETEWGKILNAALTNTSSGMFMIDFSKIMDLGSIMG